MSKQIVKCSSKGNVAPQQDQVGNAELVSPGQSQEQQEHHDRAISNGGASTPGLQNDPGVYPSPALAGSPILGQEYRACKLSSLPQSR